MISVARNISQALQLELRKISACERSLPDFIIIGAQKAGTSSLYRYLSQHKRIISPLVKEVHYFDWNYAKGDRWYRAHFPCTDALKEKEAITFEASPYYLFYPLCARRIRETIGPVKLVAILRNPIDRAYSHYQMEVRLGREDKEFEQAIWNDDVIDELEKNVLNLSARGTRLHCEKSYLQRGKYIDQLEEYYRYFPKEDIYIVTFEQFVADGNGVMSHICEFLGIEGMDFDVANSYNRGLYGEMDSELRRRLRNYFRAYNEKLYEQIGYDMKWD